MDRNSYLDPKKLIAKSRAAIKLLNSNISDNDSMKTKFKNLTDDEVLKGASADALKNNLKDYYIVIAMNLVADNSDIKDLESLIIELSGEDIYNGDIICECYDRAKKSKEENEWKAQLARAAEIAYTPLWYFKKGVGWIQDDSPNPYTALVQKYNAIVEAEKELMEIFQGKKDSFDNIEESTSSLLSGGNETREIIAEMLITMEERKKENTYVPGCSSAFLQRLLVSKNEKSNEIASEVIESDECGDLLIDPKFKEDTDVKELEKINNQYDQMVNQTGNTIASEEAKKGLNQKEVVEEREKKKKDLITNILEKTNHSKEYVEAFEKLSERGYSADELEELMWYWLKVDNMDSLEGIEIPYSWEKELKRDALYIQWIKDNQDEYTAEDYYNDYVAGKEEVISILSGRTLDDAEYEYVNDIKKRKKENPLFMDYKETGRIIGKTIVDETKILTDKTNNNKSKDLEDTFFRNVQKNPAKIVNGVYNHLSWNYSNKKIKEQYEQNKIGWNEYKNSQQSKGWPYDKYVENQHDFDDKIFYGIYVPILSEKAMKGNFDEKKGLYGANNSCELIAVYNVLTSFGEDVDFPKLTRRFSSIGPSLGGNFGTAPDDIEDYLIMSGYKAETIDTTNLSADDYEKLLNHYDAFIITDWNYTRADWAIHTMAITVEKKYDNNTGDIKYKIIRHNDFVDASGYSEETTADGLYFLLNDYTVDDQSWNNVEDGAIKIIGIVK